MKGQKNAFVVTISILAAVIIVSALIGLGVLTAIFSEINNAVIWSVAAIANVTIFSIVMINNRVSERYIKKTNETKASELYGEILAKKEQAAAMADNMRADLVKKYRSTYVKVVLFYIALTISVFLSGSCYVVFTFFNESTMDFLFVIAIFAIIFSIVNDIFLGSLVFFLIKSSLEQAFSEDKKGDKDYPNVYKTVKDVAAEEGVDKKIRVVISDEPNVGISEEKDGLVIIIGVCILKYFTKEEIRSILYHEIAHFKNEDTSFTKLRGRYYDKLFGLLPSDLYKVMAPELINIEKDNQILSFVSNIAFETKADDAVLDKNVGNAFANAAIKLFGLEYAYRLNRYDIELDLCETKKWTKEIVGKLLAGYRDFYNAHKDFFVLCSKRHLEALIPSHPNVRQRVEKFSDGGELAAELIDSAEFDDDIMKFYEDINKQVVSKQKDEVWKNIRKTYDEYAEKRDAALAKDCEIADNEALSLLSDAFDYGEYDFAKKIGLKILERSPDNSRSNLIVGLIYAFIDFSDECLPYLNRNAKEENSLFRQDALHALGEYYTITGREEERNGIREETISRMDDLADLDRAMELTLIDKPEPFSDDEVIGAVAGMAEENGDICAVSIGTKKVGKTHCHHVVLFYDRKIDDQEAFDKTCKKIWAYLELKDDQFSQTVVFFGGVPDYHALKRTPLLVYKRGKGILRRLKE